MNIALLPSAFYPSLGGVEELTRKLAIELKRHGHGVIVVTNRWPRDLPRHEVIDEIDVYRLPMRFPGECVKSRVTYGLSRGLVRRSLTRILARHRIDVLHVQCVSTQAHYATWAKRSLGLPLVVTLQGELTMDATGLYQRSERARRLMRDTLDAADVVTACSRQTLDEAEAFLERPWRQPAKVIWNGVDLDEFKAAVPFEHHRPYVFALGRHVPQKGFDVLLNAFATYLQEDRTHDLILAGDGPEKAALRSQAVMLGIADRVTFIGRAGRSQTASLFAGCSFFVLPSRHEPFGIVNIEAMAAGKAVIATRVGGVPEIVEDGENGLLVPADDSVALAKAITQLARSYPEREELGRRGLGWSARFGWPSIVREYLSAYPTGSDCVDNGGSNASMPSRLAARSADQSWASRGMTSERNVGWDRFKGIAILSIVVGHVIGALCNEKHFTSVEARRFADVLLLGGLASFFVAAGRFLPSSSRRPFAVFLKRKAYVLMLPYVVWTVLQGGVESALSSLVVPDRPFIKLIWTLWYEPYWQFWFLYVLFCCSLLGWVVVRCGFPRWSWVAIGLILHVIVAIRPTGWSIADRSLAEFVFVAIGMEWGRNLESLWRVRKTLLLLGFTLPIATLLIWISGLYQALGPQVISTAALCSGLIACGFLRSNRIGRWLSVVGEHSFAIFIGHVFLIGAMKVVVGQWLPTLPVAISLILRVASGVFVPLLIVRIVGAIWLDRAKANAASERELTDRSVGTAHA